MESVFPTHINETPQEREIDRLFFIGVLLKGVVSLAEVIGGILALTIPTFLLGTVISMSQTELMEEPGDFIATHSLQLAQQFTVGTATVIGIYLLSRGLIKLGLVVALLKNQLWAYPASLVVLGLFIVYQIYEIIIGHSILITGITLFDFVVIYLIWKEYVIVRKHWGEVN
jgi:uncharacterized membrane protein